jgi:hypothetical protein
VLNIDANGTTTSYTQLKSWLDDTRTAGTLWKSPAPTPVPLQLARIGIYLHVLQDTSSHSTYCGDDAPTAPGGGDPGTYMYASNGNFLLSFGNSCATGPHLAGHIQETGTGDNPLPLRDYVALNNTVDELIEFRNNVALAHGWIANRELLPPDVIGGKSAQGQSADDLKSTLVGTIVGARRGERSRTGNQAESSAHRHEANECLPRRIVPGFHDGDGVRRRARRRCFAEPNDPGQKCGERE